MKMVSIIVPVYNTEKYLLETINSVIDQTYNNWELILVDDGSADGSAQVIKSLQEKDNRIKYFYKENGGQASARNYGLKEAKGELIAFLDSDDIWLPAKLSEQLLEMEKFNADFHYGLGYFYYPGKKEELVEYDWITGVRTGMDFFLELYHWCAVNTNTVIVKKELFDEVGYFDENEILRGTEDWDLWMRMAKKVNNVYGSASRNVYYRIHDGGIHLQIARMFIGKLEIYSKYDNDKDVPGLLRKKEYRYIYRELINQLFKEDRSSEIKEAFKKFRKKDPFGFGAFVQSFWIKILPMPSFIWMSNNIIYRISYRLEKITYWIAGV